MQQVCRYGLVIRGVVGAVNHLDLQKVRKVLVGFSCVASGKVAHAHLELLVLALELVH